MDNDRGARDWFDERMREEEDIRCCCDNLDDSDDNCCDEAGRKDAFFQPSAGQAREEEDARLDGDDMVSV